MTKITVIGCGKIGEALVGGLVAAGGDQEITVSNRREERGEKLREKYGVTPTTDNSHAVSGADVVFVCVKPAQVPAVLEEIGEALDNNATSSVVVSMAAGLTLARLQECVPVGTPIIRVMPNTPMMVGKGVNAISPGRFVEDEQLEQVRELLASVGVVVTVPEKNMDAAGAMSGSAPAYFFLIAEALIDAGVSLGLSRSDATHLVSATVEGAGTMLVNSGDDPTTLRANVSSPGGTTVAALRELEESGIRGAFYRAAEACVERSQAMQRDIASAKDKEAKSEGAGSE